LLAARNYLDQIIKDEMIKDNKDVELLLILDNIKEDLDNFFINQISTQKHQIDINYPIV